MQNNDHGRALIRNPIGNGPFSITARDQRTTSPGEMKRAYDLHLEFNTNSRLYEQISDKFIISNYHQRKSGCHNQTWRRWRKSLRNDHIFRVEG